MKNLWVISVLFIFSVAFLVPFTGCNKESGTSSSLPTGSMTATIGASNFNSVKCRVTNSGGYYTISALNGSETGTITIDIKTSNLTVDTFKFDSTGTVHKASYSSGTLSSQSVSGFVEITEVKPGQNCSGKFEFACIDGTVMGHSFFTAVF